MGRGVGLTGFLEQCVLLWAGPELGGFLADFFGEGGETIFEGSRVFETATLHDTTSYLRVPTVGVCNPDHEMLELSGRFRGGLCGVAIGSRSGLKLPVTEIFFPSTYLPSRTENR